MNDVISNRLLRKYFSLHKHYRELHAAYVIAFKAKKEILNESEKDKLIRNWVAAMKKHQFYMKYVDGFRWVE